MPSVLKRIVASQASQAIEAFNLAGALGHPGEGGRAREEAIRTFLGELVPPDFGIDTGFVIDAVGGISRQIDIVVYRKQRAPILGIGGISHFMVESVAAAIEIKSSISSRETLHSALDNIASVKALDRSNGGRNRVVGTGGVTVDQAIFQNQVWGGIVTGNSMQYLTVLDGLIEWMEDRPRALWPNVYVDIQEFLIEYVTGIGEEGAAPNERTSDPTMGQGLSGFKPWTHDWGIEPPLGFFGVDLLDFLRVTPLIDFNSNGYFSRFSLPEEKYFVFPDEFGAEP